jgi:hypothetical protein
LSSEQLSPEEEYPELRQVVIDCRNARVSAEFYRRLLGYVYAPGHEPDPGGDTGTPHRDWLNIYDASRTSHVAFQQVDVLQESTWPVDGVPQQLHLDMTVSTVEGLNAQHGRVLALGGRMIYDRSDHPEEPLRVYADPDGHPFCIIVAPPRRRSTSN